MLRQAQHEREMINDCKTHPFALSSSKGERGVFPHPVKPQSLGTQALRGLRPPSCAEPGAEAPGGGDRKVNSPAGSLCLRLYGPKQDFGLRTARTREVKLLLKVSTKPLLKTTTHALDGMAASGVEGQ